ncbi:UNKNOWN [Stylonychia lemnae]|uniref:Uncharacterized protein n=1 Tax=Stylonychia lemnae TaxID=5949 RepID=A0A078B013_STYLE|nr:UNKNOWN [Stylonychia lemnae]|eukprot:CDW87676.1 UNKNOWN [Stylonychia lemnae]
MDILQSRQDNQDINYTQQDACSFQMLPSSFQISKPLRKFSQNDSQREIQMSVFEYRNSIKSVIKRQKQKSQRTSTRHQAQISQETDQSDPNLSSLTPNLNVYKSFDIKQQAISWNSSPRKVIDKLPSLNQSDAKIQVEQSKMSINMMIRPVLHKRMKLLFQNNKQIQSQQAAVKQKLLSQKEQGASNDYNPQTPLYESPYLIKAKALNNFKLDSEFQGSTRKNTNASLVKESDISFSRVDIPHLQMNQPIVQFREQDRNRFNSYDNSNFAADHKNHKNQRSSSLTSVPKSAFQQDQFNKWYHQINKNTTGIKELINSIENFGMQGEIQFC